MCFLPKEHDTSQKCVFFEISSQLIFALRFLQSTAQSLEKNNGSGSSKLRPEIFGVGMCDRTAGLYHVLSVSVVPSVSVESVMGCQMTCQ